MGYSCLVKPSLGQTCCSLEQKPQSPHAAPPHKKTSSPVTQYTYHFQSWGDGSPQCSCVLTPVEAPCSESPSSYEEPAIVMLDREEGKDRRGVLVSN